MRKTFFTVRGFTGTYFPEKMWMPHPRNCSRPSRSWNNMVLNVPSNTNHYMVTRRPVTPGILQPSLLGPDLSKISTKDLEEAQECILIKLVGSTSLGATSSYPWKQGWHPKRPGTHWNSARTNAGCCSREERASPSVNPGWDPQLRRTCGSWPSTSQWCCVLSVSWVLQWFILSIHCHSLWNLDNIL